MHAEHVFHCSSSGPVAREWCSLMLYGCKQENENILASACGDGSIKVWDVAAPPGANPLRSLEEHTREVCSSLIPITHPYSLSSSGPAPAAAQQQKFTHGCCLQSGGYSLQQAFCSSPVSTAVHPEAKPKYGIHSMKCHAKGWSAHTMPSLLSACMQSISHDA